jgi:hypothetical protein
MRRPDTGDPALDAAYNADVVSWLSELRGQLATGGKWGAVNQATYLAYDRTAQDEASAIGGVAGIKFHLPVKIAVEMLAMNWTGR